MQETNVLEFKYACTGVLNGWGMNALRAYGRFIGVRSPTKLKKSELIEQLIGVLCGEIVQKKTKRGAPVKNDFVAQENIDEINALKKKYLGTETALRAANPAPKQKPSTATVVLKDGEGKTFGSFSFEIKL